jgi:putative ABC transport system permease protein
MLKNYIKIAWRNLYKNKTFSLIHILGLTIGITVCMMIFIYIVNEFSVDKFHKKGKSIYRVMRGFDRSKPSVPYLSGPYGPALLNDFPNEIKNAVRVMVTTGLVTVNNNSFNEHKIYLTDPGFFTLFTFPLIKGDAATALKDPGSVVLTQSSAKKYFGKQDPMGKVIQLDKTRQLKVTGIVEDLGEKSHLKFDMVTPITYLQNEQWFNVWRNNNEFVYVELPDEASKARLERQFPEFMQKYMGQDMEKMHINFYLSLTPLTDVYFEPSSAFDNVRHGDKKVVFIFISIAILILLIACINFMNLSTIRAIERSKEVGLRKVMGALRSHLIWQFIGEAVLLTFVSCALSLGLLYLLLPWYNGLLGNSLSVAWNSSPIYLFLAGVILFAGFLAGSYPAIFLSAFSPIEALKGKLRLGKGGAFFRQGLVILQFSISVLLIIGTIIINSQMSYMKNKELGYSQDQTVIIPINNDDIYHNRNAFKTELLTNTHIASVSMMSGEPGGFFDIMSFEAEGQAEPIKSHTEFTDADFLKTLDIKLLAGRNFSTQLATDSAKVVMINRTAAARLGFTPQEAVGKWLRNPMRDSTRRTIVGVVEDFNFLSLKENMDALVISPAEDWRVMAVKLNKGGVQQGLAAIKAAYAKAAPSYPLEYNFLDQNFNELYQKDIRQQSILNIFSWLAIFIASLGLFGLASFTAAKRTKEIGVRKVLGSSVQNILLLLSKDLLKPVVYATLIAMPLGYYLMHTWLQNFAYRINLHWWIFVMAAAITFGIALFTVSFKAVKAALANPVKSLRNE